MANGGQRRENSKKRAAFEKIPYHFFSKVGRTEKKAARP